jgi:hypothetical protein
MKSRNVVALLLMILFAAFFTQAQSGLSATPNDEKVPVTVLTMVATGDFAPSASFQAEVDLITSTINAHGGIVSNEKPAQDAPNQYILGLSALAGFTKDGKPTSVISFVLMRHVKGYLFPFYLASAPANLTGDDVKEDVSAIFGVIAESEQFVAGSNDTIFEKGFDLSKVPQTPEQQN